MNNEVLWEKQVFKDADAVDGVVRCVKMIKRCDLLSEGE